MTVVVVENLRFLDDMTKEEVALPSPDYQILVRIKGKRKVAPRYVTWGWLGSYQEQIGVGARFVIATGAATEQGYRGNGHASTVPDGGSASFPPASSPALLPRGSS